MSNSLRSFNTSLKMLPIMYESRPAAHLTSSAGRPMSSSPLALPMFSLPIARLTSLVLVGSGCCVDFFLVKAGSFSTAESLNCRLNDP